MLKNITIYDVAKRANVSPATISRYLNRSTFIKPDKIVAIEKAIFELGFRPRQHKNQSATKRTMLIGIIAPCYDTAWVSTILEGMSSCSHQHNYDLLIETTQWQQDRERIELQGYKQRNVDGVIVLGGLLPASEVKNICQSLPVLFLSRGGEMGDIPVLNIDNELGGYLATTHLIQKGHTKIAYLSGPQHNLDAIQRFTGYQRALQSAGIAYNPQWVGNANFDQYGGFWQAQALKKKHPELTAIFAANDLSAFGAIQALHQMGLAVPKDVSIIGFDDVATANFFIPRLTTVQQPFFEIGQVAINAMLNMINGHQADYAIPAVTIIERESCRNIGHVSWKNETNQNIKHFQRPKVSPR